MHELANPTDHFTEAEVDPNVGQFDYDPNDDFKDAARSAASLMSASGPE
jgi:hypothetical protein